MYKDVKYNPLAFTDFNAASLDLFHFQLQTNKVYREFVQVLKTNTGNIRHFTQLPFLPVEFFKTHVIRSFEGEPEALFTSSGTTGSQVSKHQIASLSMYEQSFISAFEKFYGSPSQYCFLGLLPSYLERSESSLVYMVQKLMEISGHRENGFYLHNYDDLAKKILELNQTGTPVFLIGVTYALIDFAGRFKHPLKNTIVMETGGMKGRKKEMIREEVHQILKNAWNLEQVHSEYGMTELLSQAYAKENGKFYCPPWMKILIREVNDPFHILPPGKSGLINIIDLANRYSCAFIATQDIGKQYPDGSFEVLGRSDNSDIRGCNLMAL